MKKRKFILATITAVASLLLVNTSCTSNDNPIVPTAHKVSITVNTADMYQKLGITDYVKSFITKMGSEDFGVGVSIYLYDVSGNLISKEDGVGISSDMQTVKVEKDKLADGSYTLLVIESVTEKGDEPMVLVINNPEKLSTIELVNRFMTFIPAEISFGYKMVHFTINGRDADVTVTPEPAGSVVDVTLKATDKSGIIDAYLIAENVPAGFFPDDKPDEPDVVSKYRTRNESPKAEVANLDVRKAEGNVLNVKAFLMNMAGKYNFQIIGLKSVDEELIVDESEVDVKLGGHFSVVYDWDSKTSSWN